MRRQGARDRTSGGEEIRQSQYTLEANADPKLLFIFLTACNV